MDLVTEQKLERRSRMLEATRALIAERRYDEITVKDLAEACRVSVPTIYNTFGGKDELIGEAVRTNFAQVMERVQAESGVRGWQRLLSLVEQSAAEMNRLPRYHRSLIGYFAASIGGAGLSEAIARLFSDEIETALAEMRSARQLADWVDTALLAEQVAGTCVMAAVEWALGLYDGDGLAAAMTYGSALLVLGAARGKARDGLQARIVEVQDRVRAIRPEGKRLPG